MNFDQFIKQLSESNSFKVFGGFENYLNQLIEEGGIRDAEDILVYMHIAFISGKIQNEQ